MEGVSDEGLVGGIARGRGRRAVAARGELACHLGLTARHDGDVVGAARDGERERVVGGRVAGVQRRHDLHARGQLGVGDAPGDEMEPLLPVAGRARGRAVDELGPRLDGPQRAAPRGPEHELVEQRPERALAGAAVDDRGRGVARERVLEGRAQQAHEVTDLLELAARVGVELPLAREQMQLLEQRDRHALGHVGIGPWVEHLSSQRRDPTSGRRAARAPVTRDRLTCRP